MTYAKKVSFLGRKLTKRWKCHGKFYAEAIKDWEPPKTTKQVNNFWVL